MRSSIVPIPMLQSRSLVRLSGAIALTTQRPMTELLSRPTCSLGLLYGVGVAYVGKIAMYSFELCAVECSSFEVLGVEVAQPCRLPGLSGVW